MKYCLSNLLNTPAQFWWCGFVLPLSPHNRGRGGRWTSLPNCTLPRWSLQAGQYQMCAWCELKKQLELKRSFYLLGKKSNLHYTRDITPKRAASGGAISASKRLHNTTSKNHHSDGEPLATLYPICTARNRTPDLPRQKRCLELQR